MSLLKFIPLFLLLAAFCAFGYFAIADVPVKTQQVVVKISNDRFFPSHSSS